MLKYHPAHKTMGTLEGIFAPHMKSGRLCLSIHLFCFIFFLGPLHASAMEVAGSFFKGSAKAETGARMSSAHDKGDYPSVELTDLTEDQAKTLFQKFKNEKQTIAYPSPEACFAKAMAMVKMGEQNGYKLGKIFVEVNQENLNEDLERGPSKALLVASKVPGQVISWHYHVATLASVKLKGQREPVKMVLDPFLFDGPVLEDEWKKALSYQGYKACDEGETICDSAYGEKSCKGQRCEALEPEKVQDMQVYYGNRFQYLPLSLLKEEMAPFRDRHDPADEKKTSDIFTVFKKYPDGNLNLNELYSSVPTENLGNDQRQNVDSEAAPSMSQQGIAQ